MKLSQSFLNQLPQTAGVYQFYDDRGSILYIGKAKNLKKRIKTYFNKNQDVELKTKQLIKRSAHLKFINVTSEFEALLLEAELIKRHQPKYNVIWKDDRHYIYIKITNEEFPRILLSRHENEIGANYFGPFPSSGIVKEVLGYIRSIFPYCTQNPRIKKGCFYSHIGLCKPCPAQLKQIDCHNYKIGKRLYLENIKRIKILLQGKTGKVKNCLQRQMKNFSKKEEFEQAAIIRDRLAKLEYLITSYHPTGIYIQNPLFAEQLWQQEEKNLTDFLSDYFSTLNIINRIECYDISCLSGKFAVGSMITFINGQPAKDHYRRFRIKSLTKKNDLDMLKEVVKRRLRHQEWLKPDLIIVDGGRPQLASVKKIILEARLDIPVIGLVKSREKLVIPYRKDFIDLYLSSDSDALHLIQRLRDEAHRFAHRYHENIRLKSLISGVESKETI